MARAAESAYDKWANVASVDEALALVGGSGLAQQQLLTFGFAMWAANGASTMSMVYINPSFSDDTREASRSLFFIGWMLGLLHWGPYARRNGWKATFLIAQVLGSTFGICGALAPTGHVYMAARLAGGFAEGALPTTCFSYVNEFLPTSQRARGGAMVQLGFSVGSVLLSVLAYIVHSWRVLSAMCALAGLPIAIAAAAHLPESPRWLHEAGHSSRLLFDLRRLAVINGVPGPPDGFRMQQRPKETPGGKKALLLGLGKGGSVGGGLCGGLCASRALLRTTLLLCVLWMASLFVLYGISFDTGHMYGEGLAQSVMIAGPLIQWPMLLATTHQLERAGRLPPTRWLFGLASLSCLGLALTASHPPAVMSEEVSSLARWSEASAQAEAEAARFDRLWRLARRFGMPQEEQAEAQHAAESAAEQATQVAAAAAAASQQLSRDEQSWLFWFSTVVSVIASAVGRASAAVAMNAVYILSAELWPTQIRSVGMCAGSMASRMGGALSPAILWASRGGPPATPYLIFSLVALVGAFTTCALPESRGCRTLETAADLHDLIDSQHAGARTARGGAPHSLLQTSWGTNSLLTDEHLDDEDEDECPGSEVPLLGRSPTAARAARAARPSLTGGKV
jgi:MFS family permease